MSRIIAITSGKGGVGKTNLCLNLALYLSSREKRACLFDADLGLANINILLGLQPEFTLKDLILDNKDVEDIIVRDYKGIDILPGSTGVEELANLGPSDSEKLAKSLAMLGHYDYLLFDTSAGIAKNVLAFCLSAPEVAVVITPEPTSLTDAYSLIKVLLNNGYDGKLYAIVNQCKDMDAAKAAYGKFKGAVVKYLKTDILPLGVVFEDPKVVEAVKDQTPFLLKYPQCKASQCLKKIGERLIAGPEEELAAPEIEDFWQKCLSVIKGPLKLVGKGAAESKKAHAKEQTDASQGLTKETGQQVQVTPSQTTQSLNESNVPHAPAQGLAQQPWQSSVAPLLEELVRGIASVSEELRQLREGMQGNGKRGEESRHISMESGQTGKKPVVKIDIEAFLVRKGIKQKAR